MDNFKPMLATDWYEDKVKFPCIVQAKIDGCHSINRHGKLLGRSLKAHDNLWVTEDFSYPEFHGFCGEMYATELGDNHPDLCRITSGHLRRIKGEPKITWLLFDYVTEETKDLGYVERMNKLEYYLDSIRHLYNDEIKVIQSTIVNSMQELLALEEEYLNEGYEGIIIREPNAPYKYGRCGKTFMGVWRVKRFIDAEFLIEEIEEGNKNNNEAITNELGRTERSSHQENMQPNGLVGALLGTLLDDVLDPQTKAVIIRKGEKIKVAPGSMDHAMRKYYFENQSEILNQIGKFKLFPKGTKQLPRFPQFTSIRNPNDL